MCPSARMCVCVLTRVYQITTAKHRDLHSRMGIWSDTHHRQFIQTFNPAGKLPPKKPTGISISVNSPKHLRVKSSLPRKFPPKQTPTFPQQIILRTFPQMPAVHHRAACYIYVNRTCIYRRQIRGYKRCYESSLPPKLFCPIRQL